MPQTVQEIMSRYPVTMQSTSTVREPAGVVSLGDLALERDPNSALSDISAAVPNQ